MCLASNNMLKRIRWQCVDQCREEPLILRSVLGNNRVGFTEAKGRFAPKNTAFLMYKKGINSNKGQNIVITSNVNIFLIKSAGNTGLIASTILVQLALSLLAASSYAQSQMRDYGDVVKYDTGIQPKVAISEFITDLASAHLSADKWLAVYIAGLKEEQNIAIGDIESRLDANSGDALASNIILLLVPTIAIAAYIVLFKPVMYVKKWASTLKVKSIVAAYRKSYAKQMLLMRINASESLVSCYQVDSPGSGWHKCDMAIIDSVSEISTNPLFNEYLRHLHARYTDTMWTTSVSNALGAGTIDHSDFLEMCSTMMSQVIVLMYGVSNHEMSNRGAFNELHIGLLRDRGVALGGLTFRIFRVETRTELA